MFFRLRDFGRFTCTAVHFHGKILAVQRQEYIWQKHRAIMRTA